MEPIKKVIFAFATRAIIGILITRIVVSLFEEKPKPSKKSTT